MNKVELLAIEKAGNCRNHLMLNTLAHVFIAIIVIIFNGKQYFEVFHLYWALMILSFAFSLVGNFLPKTAATLQFISTIYILLITTRYSNDFELGTYLLLNSYSFTLAFSAWFTLFRKQMLVENIPSVKTLKDTPATSQNRNLRKTRRREYLRSKLSTKVKSTGYRG